MLSQVRKAQLSRSDENEDKCTHDEYALYTNNQVSWRLLSVATAHLKTTRHPEWLLMSPQPRQRLPMSGNNKLPCRHGSHGQSVRLASLYSCFVQHTLPSNYPVARDGQLVHEFSKHDARADQDVRRGLYFEIQS